ncbi:hypothetical protein CCHL11_00216 [Colletotrichum chlorophyti]|uniref:Uncharacterized protein n=1 Tax=Colletotrichum chlorophyti TaxID=708187 RepID=A0A1Q8RUK0_9PEZI|nr:hypothetical protein CCHL11_00216 [Colletotrichum chlorophyti]
MASQAQNLPFGRLLAIFLLLVCGIFSPGASANASPALDPAAVNATLQDISILYLDTDAACTDNEGQWNCLSDKFQHCSGGRWSAAVPCGGGGGLDVSKGWSGAETLCTPLGRTDLVEFDGECSAAWGFGSGNNGGGGWNGGGGGVSCNNNRCYYGAGSRVGVGRWVYVVVTVAAVVGFW